MTNARVAPGDGVAGVAVLPPPPPALDFFDDPCACWEDLEPPALGPVGVGGAEGVDADADARPDCCEFVSSFFFRSTTGALAGVEDPSAVDFSPFPPFAESSALPRFLPLVLPDDDDACWACALGAVGVDGRPVVGDAGACAEDDEPAASLSAAAAANFASASALAASWRAFLWALPGLRPRSLCRIRAAAAIPALRLLGRS